MNRKPMSRILMAGILALGVCGMCSTAMAQTKLGENGSKPTCTLQTLKGRYLFAHSGTVLPPAFGVTEATPGADVGYHIFNGDGTGTDTVTVRIGAIVVAGEFRHSDQLYGQRGLYGQLHSAQWAILRSIHRTQWRPIRHHRDGSSRQLPGGH